MALMVAPAEGPFLGTFKHLATNSSPPMSAVQQNRWFSHVFRLQSLQGRNSLWKPEFSPLTTTAQTLQTEIHTFLHPSALTSLTLTRKAKHFTDVHGKNYIIDCHRAFTMGGIVQDCQG